MFAIHKNKVKVGKEMVKTFYRDAGGSDFCLVVEAGTTGHSDEHRDVDHVRAYLKMLCKSVDVCFDPIWDNQGVWGVKVSAMGDEGLDAVLKALRFALKVMEDQCNDVHD